MRQSKIWEIEERENDRILLTVDSPNELRGLSLRIYIVSRKNKRVCCCFMAPTLQSLSLNPLVPERLSSNFADLVT